MKVWHQFLRFLKQGGHDVKLMHLLNLHTEEAFKARLREMGEFDIIGFSIRTTAFPDCQLYIKWTKEVYPDTFIICGSYHPTALFLMRFLPSKEWTASASETEEYAELELCDKMRDGEDYTGVQSLYFKMPDGSFKHNPIRPLFSDLDQIPIPDFDLFDYDNLESSKVGTAIVIVSRGCFYNCTYCGNGNFRKVYPNKKIMPASDLRKMRFYILKHCSLHALI